MRGADPFASMEGATTPSPAEGGALAADEFARRWQAAGRVLWTIAAGVLGDTGDVEDVLQEACVLALGKLETYREDVHPTAWMGRFVRHVALNQLRKRGRRGTRAVAPDELSRLEERGALAGASEPARQATPVDARGQVLADQAAFDDALVAALAELSPTQRAALLLRSVHELSYREVSRVLEIPEGTAMSHVHRARRTLREALFASEPHHAPSREPR